MAEPITFIELPNAGELSASAIIAIVQEQTGELLSLNASLGQVADLTNGKIQYPDLPTEAKTIKGAIAEIANGRIILTSEGGNKFTLAVSDTGELSTVAVVEEEEPEE